MLDNLLIFIPMCIVFAIMPGPDFAVILKTSFVQGRREAQGVACGIAAGILLHTSAAVLGLSALIAGNLFLFEMLRYAGAAYLFWLGIQALRARPAAAREGAETKAGITEFNSGRGEGAVAGFRELDTGRGSTPTDWRRSFTRGLLVNALNPKAVIFFLTFLPQFISPGHGAAQQLMVLGLIMTGITFTWFFLLSSFMAYVRRYIENRHFRIWLERFTGLLMISFGLKLILADR